LENFIASARIGWKAPLENNIKIFKKDRSPKENSE
jgi:hypothetical protein